jgi:hypothetical protein
MLAEFMFRTIAYKIEEAVSPISERKTTALFVIAISILSICIAMLSWFPLLRIGSLPSINYNEGWNAYRQWMTVVGQPLYGAQPGLWVTNYPFLSFHIVGLLGAAIGDVVLAGRLLSFVSLMVVSALLGGIVRIGTGSSRGGLYAGLCLFLWIATFTPDRRAMNDPELLGAAFATFGLFAYVKAPRAALWLGLSAFAFAMSLFTKLDFIALPASVGLHLLLTRRWRALMLWGAAGIASAGLLLALALHWDGAYFFAHILWPRAYLARCFFSNMGNYLPQFGLPLGLSVFLLVRYGRSAYRGLLFILLIVTHVTALFFSSGDGVDSNIYYPPLIADVLACAFAVCALERALPRNPGLYRGFIAALALPVLAGVAFVPYRFHKDLVAQQALPDATRSAQRAIAFLRSAEGPAICEDILLCYRAGKQVDYDPYFVKDQILIGRLKEADVLAMLASHHYAAIQMTGVVDTVSPVARKKRRRFTQGFMQALAAEYRPALTSGTYSLFTPRNEGAAHITLNTVRTGAGPSSPLQ